MPPEPFFSGAGLDRSDHARADEEELRRLAAHPEALELIWRDGFPAIGADGRPEWRPVADPALFLGREGDAPRFSPLQERFGDVRSAFGLLGQIDAAQAPLFAAALSLARWHSRHGFCANCGQPAEAVRGGWARHCPACDAEHFPRVDPVVIMIAEHDDCLLLGRQPHYPPGRYSALAGFVEVGESVEAAVARELKEEAGIDVREVAYVASQPWPFPNSLMIGCHARAESSELTIDTNELDDAGWFSRAEIAGALAGASDARFQPPPPAAIARTLLEHWLSS